MNIVLTSVHIRKSPDAIPLAPALLKSYITSNNKKYYIDIKEFYINDNVKKVATAIMTQKPKVVGFSIYLWNREFYKKLAMAIKEINRKVILVAGGAEVRSSYKDLLKSGIDYTLQGEGEELFLEFLNALSKNKKPDFIDGINDSINRYIKNINSIPSPLLNKTMTLKGRDGFLWELSRGCPFACDFCFESRGTKGVRYYNFDRIEKELNEIVKQKVPQVFVLDPTFNKDLPRAKKILRLIKKKKCSTHFHFEVRAEFLDNEIAELFAAIGASIQIGIQSGSDEVLKTVNRRLNKKIFTEKINLLNRHGVIFGLDLIYGLPKDNYQGFKDSMEYVLSLQPNHIDIFPLAVLPGTALKDNAKKLKLNYSAEPPYTVISSPTFSKDDMKKAELLKLSCDYIYNYAKSTGWLYQVIKELKISFTSFIEDFSTYVKPKTLKARGNEVETIKRFIEDTYKPKMIDLIVDIINYHNSYSKALLLKKKRTYISKDKLIKAIPSFPRTTSLIETNYNILDAFDNGLFTIDEIKRLYSKENGRYITWFHSHGEVLSDSYSKEIMNFLVTIDGKKRSFELAPEIDIEFLYFAQESGMLLFK